MRAGALILGILGGLGALSLGFVAYLFGGFIGFAPANAAAAGTIKFFAVVIPLVALVGAAIVMAKPVVGGLLMIASALALFFTLGFGVFTFTTEILIAVGGTIGLLSANSAKSAPIARGSAGSGD